MCIAIYKPAEINLTDNLLHVCHKANPDGCGFAYISVDPLGNKAIVIKKTMVFSQFLADYKQAQQEFPDSPYLIHFRIRTHGETTEFNCHPFSIDDNHVFIHNGIIRGMRVDALKSDTQIFNEDYLRLLPEGWMHNIGVKKLIESFIDFNKIVVMNLDGQVTIYNENKGEWNNGSWFSNKSYVERAAYVPTTTQSWQNTGSYYGPKSGNKVVPIQQRDANENTQVRCSRCKKSHGKIKAMFHYYLGGECFSLCLSCYNDNKVLSPAGVYIDDQCFIDWKNTTLAEAAADYTVWFTTWINPWGEDIRAEEEIPTEEDLNEYYDLLEDRRFAQ